jgi:anti-sigma factor RsiW
MIDCERIQESLGGWLDGELSSADSDSVRAHVASCGDCRAAQRRLETMTVALRGALTSDASKIDFAPFWRAVERRIEAQRPWYGTFQDWAQSFFTAPRAAWAVPAAIAAVLAVISANSFFTGWRGVSTRNNFASVDSIDSYGRSVALLREDDTKTTVIWLYQNQEDENEAAEESAPSGPAF